MKNILCHKNVHDILSTWDMEGVQAGVSYREQCIHFNPITHEVKVKPVDGMTRHYHSLLTCYCLLMISADYSD